MWAMLFSVAHGFPIPLGGIGGTTPPFNQYTCEQCHADNSQSAPYSGSGPHKNYAATTNKCVVCHKVHNAPAGGIKLLPAATVTATCLTCHDGTASSIGPYDSITAHAGTVAGEHTCEAGSAIPGGTTALDRNLSCSHCHAVHGAKTVVAFLRDSGRAGTASSSIGGSDEYVTSDCLLRSDLRGTVAGTYPEYGAQWCAACHDQRHSVNGAGVVNHPVDNIATWGYGDVVSTLLTPGLWRLEQPVGSGQAISLGRTNSGYIMAPAAAASDGRIELANRRAPMCQQCHEDARDMEGVVFDGDYSFRGSDPWNLHTNPAFLTFPHQTTGSNMLVETYDDLCTNCHPADGLP